MYHDVPSQQLKVPVRDKARIVCSEDETFMVEPAALQRDIDAAVQCVRDGRCFVRPSGTEDVVRIYAEATTSLEAQRLAQLAHEAILRHLA